MIVRLYCCYWYTPFSENPEYAQWSSQTDDAIGTQLFLDRDEVYEIHASVQ